MKGGIETLESKSVSTKPAFNNSSPLSSTRPETKMHA